MLFLATFHFLELIPLKTLVGERPYLLPQKHKGKMNIYIHIYDTHHIYIFMLSCVLVNEAHATGCSHGDAEFWTDSCKQGDSTSGIHSELWFSGSGSQSEPSGHSVPLQWWPGAQQQHANEAVSAAWPWLVIDPAASRLLILSSLVSQTPHHLCQPAHGQLSHPFS